MRCPNCDYDKNAPTAKFCEECGQSLTPSEGPALQESSHESLPVPETPSGQTAGPTGNASGAHSPEAEFLRVGRTALGADHLLSGQPPMGTHGEAAGGIGSAIPGAGKQTTPAEQQAAPGETPTDSSSPAPPGEVVVQLDTAAEHCVQESCLLSFRVTNVLESEIEIRLHAKCLFNEILNSPIESNLWPQEGLRLLEYSFGFVPGRPGKDFLEELTVEVCVPGEGRRVLYELPDNSVKLQIAREPGQSASVSVDGGITVNITDAYGTDIANVVNLAAQQSGTKISDHQPQWQAVKLRKVLEERAPTIVGPLPAEPFCAAKLVWEGLSGRKLFLFPMERLHFGKSTTSSDGLRNEVILRFLPCDEDNCDRKAYRDTKDAAYLCQNCAATMRISRGHGAFVVRGDSVWVTDRGSKYGIQAESRRVRGEQALPDRAEVTVPAEAGDVSGLRMSVVTHRSPEGAPLLPILDKAGLPASPDSPLGLENQGGIDCVSIRRTSNAPEHEYLMLLRRASIGPGLQHPISITGSAASGAIAELLLYRSFVFLHSLSSTDGIAVNDTSLSQGQWHPLRLRDRIAVAGSVLLLQEIHESDFKRLRP